MSDPKTTPPSAFDQLTPEQKERLKALSSEIRIDKVTVSFSIEDRDVRGRKKSAFYCVTSSRGHGAEITQMHEAASPAGFSPEEVKVVRCLLSKHVVATVYDDAAKRGIMSSEEAQQEGRQILAAYDAQIVKVLAGKS